MKATSDPVSIDVQNPAQETITTTMLGKNTCKWIEVTMAANPSEHFLKLPQANYV